MKKIKFIILFIFIFLLNIQGVYAYDEVFKINDENNEYKNVSYTSNGGCVVVGNTENQTSAYIAIYNIDGEKVNETVYGEQFTCFFSAIQTSDSGYIAVGKNSTNNSDALIVKFDSKLNVLWEKKYIGSKYERFNSVIETTDGNIIAVGITDEENGNIKPAKGLIVKYDKNGNQLWANKIGGTSYDVFNSVIETSDNCYIVAGTFKSKDLEDLEINGETDAVIFKFNCDGELIWKKSYGGSSYDSFSSIIKTNDGGYVAVGATTSKDIEDITDIEQWKCLIVKYDQNFNALWNKGYGSGHQSGFLSVIELANNDIVAVGETHTISPINHGILIQYDAEGNFIYSEGSSPEESIIYNSITATDNGFLYIDTNLNTNTSQITKYSDNIEREEENTTPTEDSTISKEDAKSTGNSTISKEDATPTKDQTTAKGVLPNAGSALYIIGLLLILVAGAGIASYIRNKCIKLR